MFPQVNAYRAPPYDQHTAWSRRTTINQAAA